MLWWSYVAIWKNTREMKRWHFSWWFLFSNSPSTLSDKYCRDLSVSLWNGFFFADELHFALQLAAPPLPCLRMRPKGSLNRLKAHWLRSGVPRARRKGGILCMPPMKWKQIRDAEAGSSSNWLLELEASATNGRMKTPVSKVVFIMKARSHKTEYLYLMTFG